MDDDQLSKVNNPIISCFRVPLSYQYSVLSQFEGMNDNDDDLSELGQNDDDVGIVISQDSSDDDEADVSNVSLI